MKKNIRDIRFKTFEIQNIIFFLLIFINFIFINFFYFLS